MLIVTTVCNSLAVGIGFRWAVFNLIYVCISVRLGYLCANVLGVTGTSLSLLISMFHILVDKYFTDSEAIR